jgi:hypothetical protein
MRRQSTEHTLHHVQPKVLAYIPFFIFYTSSIVIIFQSGCDKSSGLAMHPQNFGGLLLDLRSDRRGYARLPVDLMPPAAIALLERHRVVARQAMGE